MGRTLNAKNKSSMSQHLEFSPDVQVPNDSRAIFLHGDVTEELISYVSAQLIQMSSANKKKPITLIVSTYGGAVDEMFLLYDLIKFVPCPIHTIGLGKIMSAGVLLLASGQHGYRKIGKNTRVMIHSISASTWGNVFQHNNEIQELQRMQEKMVLSLSVETGMSVAKIEKMMKHGDFYVDAEKAIELGIADSIL